MTEPKYPCSHMKTYAEFACDAHMDLWDCPDALIHYEPRFDEYGLPIKDGGTAKSIIAFCPWCGVQLPESKRDGWFDALEALGIDPWEDEVPEAFKSAEWWQNPG